MLDNRIEIYTVANGYILRNSHTDDYCGKTTVQNSHVFNEVSELCKFLRKEICTPEKAVPPKLNK